MNTNNRLFTFGCSFTNYHYPTWADIVSSNFSEFQNWGNPGAGNNFILNSITECHQRNQLTENDTVIILWSGLSRIDHYQLNTWTHQHNQYFDLGTANSSFSCPQGYEMLSYGWISAVVFMLNHLKLKWKMFHWVPFDVDSAVYEIYSGILSNLIFAPFQKNSHVYNTLNLESSQIVQDLYNRMAGPDWPGLSSIIDHSYIQLPLDNYIKSECKNFLNSVKQDKRISPMGYQNTVDLHPSPVQHLNWVQKYLPEYSIGSDTINWINNIDQQILNQQLFEFRPSRVVRL